MPEPGVRILLHTGFYKTGTSNLQSFLGRNRARLSPHATICMGRDLGAARFLGRWYGQRPDALRLWLFRRAFRRFLRRLPDHGTFIISRESLSGMMMGFNRRGHLVTSYPDMAIPLARAMIAEIHRRFGPTADIAFLYTLRDAPGLLASTYGHVLRSSVLTDDWLTWRTRFTPQPDLAAQAREIAKAIAPVPVHVSPLEQAATHRLGHGATLLRLLNVPEPDWRAFKPGKRTNEGPGGAERLALLDINRAGGTRRQITARKAALMQIGLPRECARGNRPTDSL